MRHLPLRPGRGRRSKSDLVEEDVALAPSRRSVSPEPTHQRKSTVSAPGATVIIRYGPTAVFDRRFGAYSSRSMQPGSLRGTDHSRGRMVRTILNAVLRVYEGVSTSTTTGETHMDRIAYSVVEAAEMVGLSRSSLYEQIAAGHLRVVKVGRRTVVPADELRAWLTRLAETADRDGKAA